MGNVFDYLAWRGDLSLVQVPFGPVDNLILSALSYVPFDGIVPGMDGKSISIKSAAQMYFSLSEERRGHARCQQDLELLRSVAKSSRFSKLRLIGYVNCLQPDEEMQFAAVAVLIDKDTAFLAFRGTDDTIVGWKEDFNMSFRDIVPAQEEALHYTETFADHFPGRLILGGHSKGGNLALYAATQSSEGIRRRVLDVYNNDGPGFTSSVLETTGYKELLPKVHTYLPQSSLVGMLLEHEESYTVVRSLKTGPWQHDLYSWEILGGDFIRMEEVTAGSRMADKAIKEWLACLKKEEREEFVDGIFSLLLAGEASYTSELKRPANIHAALRTWKFSSGETRRLMTHTFAQLLLTAIDTLRDELRRKED